MKSAEKMVMLVSVATVSLLLVEACRAPAGHMLVDAGTSLSDAGFGDAGMILVDAGNNLADAGWSDAGAQAGVGTRSGSRLQVYRTGLSGADGSQVDWGPNNLHDSLLGIDCASSYFPMSDGTLRCVPSAGQVSDYYFSDAACTMKLGIASTAQCTAAPTYFSQYVSGACISGFAYTIRYYHAGTEHLGNVYSMSGTTCTMTTRATGTQYFSLGAEAPPSDFVQLTATRTP